MVLFVIKPLHHHTPISKRKLSIISALTLGGATIHTTPTSSTMGPKGTTTRKPYNSRMLPCIIIQTPHPPAGPWSGPRSNPRKGATLYIESNENAKNVKEKGGATKKQQLATTSPNSRRSTYNDLMLPTRVCSQWKRKSVQWGILWEAGVEPSLLKWASCCLPAAGELEVSKLCCSLS